MLYNYYLYIPPLKQISLNASAVNHGLVSKLALLAITTSKQLNFALKKDNLLISVNYQFAYFVSVCTRIPSIIHLKEESAE